MTAQAGDTLITAARKQALRAELRRRRTALSLAYKRRSARRVAAQARRLIVSKHARHVAIYLTIGSELDTAPLRMTLRHGRLRIYLPRLCGARMAFVPRRHAKTMDIIFLPLLGFDAHGTRLGQGGGHYDRALAFRRCGRRPLRVGLAYAAQQVDTLPRDAHDVPLDAVITERGLWNFRKAFT